MLEHPEITHCDRTGYPRWKQEELEDVYDSNYEREERNVKENRDRDRRVYHR